jgi:CRISPR system Cascade subunit CasE
MIFLSQLLLDPMSRRVQNELRSPYEMHRTLCHAFPGLSDEEWKNARVLFRVDDDRNILMLLVQSKLAPDWNAFASRLNGRYLLGEPRAKAWEPHFHEGQRLRFRLQANPTMALNTGKDAKRGARCGLYREAERLDWLRARGKQSGFALPLFEETLRASEQAPLVFRGREHRADLKLELPVCELRDLNDGRSFPIAGRANQFSAARFDGELRVVNPQALGEAVESGIGKARGFGFGLLSVAPATS